MSQECFLTVPFSGEIARPFEVLFDEASAALPAGFPTSAGEVLVAFDIDGTILTAAGATPRVFEGIHGLTAAGAQVLIASDRALEGVIPVLGILELTDGWALCNNGATLVRASGGEREIVEEHILVPGPILEEIATAVPGSVFASMPHPDIFLFAPLPNSEIEGSDHRVASVEEPASTPTLKVAVRVVEMDREELGRILSSLDVSYIREVLIGWASWADVEPLGVTKASGLEPLRQRFGLPVCGVVAVGDGANDIAMIEWMAFGVTMGGVSEEMCAHADHVTAVVDNDGTAVVMYAIMHRCGGVGC